MKFKKSVFFIFSLLISLIVVELALRFIVPNLIILPYANKIYDDKLGFRMNQSLIGIDQNGFRNPESVEQADIVVLGDSHTYGYNVSSEQSWPQQLAKMANMSVYNFGVGGYGSLQYYYLIDEAIKFKPKHIILGLYLANDLNEACKLISKLDYCQKRVQELGFDVEVCVQSSDKGWSINQFISKLHLSMLVDSAYKKIKDGLNLGNKIDVREDMNSTIIKLKRIASHKNWMDLEQERISLGFEVTKRIIEDIKSKADSSGIEFSVVFIPSKERGYYDFLNEKDYKLPTDYDELIDNEIELLNKFAYFFKEHEIKFVDANPYVKQKLYKSKNVYTPSDNGHPLAIGYKAYAEAVFDCIFTKNNKTEVENCNKLPLRKKHLR